MENENEMKTQGFFFLPGFGGTLNGCL